MDGIFIQDRFSIHDPETNLVFSDALVMPEDEYRALKQSEIDDLKQQRFVAWQDMLVHPPVVVQPDPVDVIAAIDEQISDLISQKQALQDTMPKGK